MSKIILVAGLLLFSESALSMDARGIENTQAESVGVAAFNEERYQDAEAYFLKNISDSNQKNDALIYLSRIALVKDDTEQAIKYIEQALDVEPNNADEIVLSGDIYCSHAQNSSIFSALKLAKKCIAQYDAAVNIDPDNIDALVSAINFYLGAPSIAGGSTEKGSLLLDRLSKLSPEDGNTCRLNQSISSGNKEAALKWADALRNKGFHSARNQYAVAHFYRDQKLYTEAKALFESLITLPKTLKNKWYVNDSLLQLGEILLIEKSDINRSIELLSEYKKMNSNPNDTHYYWSSWSLAKAYKAAGKKDQYDLQVKKIKSENYKKDKAFAKEFEAAIKSSN